MSNCIPWKCCDSGIIKEYLEAGKGIIEEPLTLKSYVSTTAGDVTKGIAKTFVYNTSSITGIVSNITQQDVVQSGGIYQVGDIAIQLTIELNMISDKTQNPGDRIIWRGHEYRPVGNIRTNYMSGYVLYDYAFRRI